MGVAMIWGFFLALTVVGVLVGGLYGFISGFIGAGVQRRREERENLED